MLNGGGGKSSGAPETDEIVTRAPLSTVRTGVRLASKKPQWTVEGPASIRGILRDDSNRTAPVLYVDLSASGTPIIIAECGRFNANDHSSSRPREFRLYRIHDVASIQNFADTNRHPCPGLRLPAPFGTRPITAFDCCYGNFFRLMVATSGKTIISALMPSMRM